MDQIGNFGDQPETTVTLSTSPTEHALLVLDPGSVGSMTPPLSTELTMAPGQIGAGLDPRAGAMVGEGVYLPGGVHARSVPEAADPMHTSTGLASQAPTPAFLAHAAPPTVTPGAATPSADPLAVNLPATAVLPAASAGNGHMNLSFSYASGTTLSTAAQAALNYTASYLDNLIADPVNVTIGIDVTNLGSGIVSEGGAVYDTMSFSQVESHIHAAAPNFVLPSLPSGTSPDMYISKAEGLAWGTDKSSGVDGNVWINSSFMNSFDFSTSLAARKANSAMDFVGVMAHEITHALGRVPEGVQTSGSIIMPLDLFDYTQAGTLVADGHYSRSSVPANFFSVDGGKTLLNQFAGVNSDPSDWASGGIPHDAFNAYVPSNYATLSSVDATLMNALGFDVNYAALPCFAEGTRILTTRGEVAVEALAVDDRLVLAGGGTAPLRWIGRRTLDIARQPEPGAVLPVLIRAGAIGEGLPARDLLVSPDHAIFLDGHLIPAKTLITLESVRQMWREKVTYYHLELPEHGVIFAEGLAAESYLDTGNRSDFAGVGTQVSAAIDRAVGSCAPLTEAGAVVEAVRRRILARERTRTTADPDLRIERLANGGALIRSRRVVPGFATPDPRDRRCLGVKIDGLICAGMPILLDHPELTDGWHDVEADGRWTDGGAIIPPSLCVGKIEISIAGSLSYPLQP